MVLETFIFVFELLDSIVHVTNVLKLLFVHAHGNFGLARLFILGLEVVQLVVELIDLMVFVAFDLV